MPEQQNIEWKESWRDEYLKWICAFSNTKGGTLVIGKTDDGSIKGLSGTKDLMEQIPNKIINLLGINCGVNLKVENELEYIEIDVEPSEAPINYKGLYFIRTGSTTRQLTGQSLTNFLLNKSKIVWEKVLVEEGALADVDLNAVDYFIQKVKKSGRLPFIDDTDDVEVLFQNLGLVTKEGFYTRAALLLFGKEPLKYASTAFVKIGKFGETSTDLLAQDIVESNAIQITDKVLEILDLKYFIKEISYEELQRIETPPYPYEAIREMLFNAIIHRKYENSPVFISIYDDRISIWNHGELTPELQIDDLKTNHASFPRNELLADIFYKAGFIESWGRGTLKVLQECKNHGLPEPKIINHSGGFEITIFNEVFTDKYLDGLGLNDRQKQAVQYIKENEFITSGIYQTEINTTKSSAGRDIDELIELEVIKSKGTGRATKYFINVDGYKTR